MWNVGQTMFTDLIFEDANPILLIFITGTHK